MKYECEYIFFSIEMLMNYVSLLYNVSFAFLLYVLMSHSFLVTGEFEVDTEPEVVLQKDTRGMLPCRVNPSVDVGIVFWSRGSTLSTGETVVTMSILGGTKIKSGTGYGSGLYDVDDELSLIINNVSVEDNDNFFCEISEEGTGDLSHNQTYVAVFGKWNIFDIIQGKRKPKVDVDIIIIGPLYFAL